MPKIPSPTKEDPGDKSVTIWLSHWRWADAPGGLQVKLMSKTNVDHLSPCVRIKIRKQGVHRSQIKRNVYKTWMPVWTYDVEARIVDRYRIAMRPYRSCSCE